MKIKIYRCTKHGYERVYEANFQWTSTETEIVIVSLAERQLDRRGFPMEHDVAWPDLIVFKELDSFNSSNCTKYPLQTITIQRLNFYTRVFRVNLIYSVYRIIFWKKKSKVILKFIWESRVNSLVSILEIRRIYDFFFKFF